MVYLCVHCLVNDLMEVDNVRSLPFYLKLGEKGNFSNIILVRLIKINTILTTMACQDLHFSRLQNRVLKYFFNKELNGTSHSVYLYLEEWIILQI